MMMPKRPHAALSIWFYGAIVFAPTWGRVPDVRRLPDAR